MKTVEQLLLRLDEIRDDLRFRCSCGCNTLYDELIIERNCLLEKIDRQTEESNSGQTIDRS